MYTSLSLRNNTIQLALEQGADWGTDFGAVENLSIISASQSSGGNFAVENLQLGNHSLRRENTFGSAVGNLRLAMRNTVSHWLVVESADREPAAGRADCIF